MKKSHRQTLRQHRRRQKERGLIRVEIQAPSGDAALIREVAAHLRSGSRRAGEVRSALRRALKPSKRLIDLLALDLPDDVVDLALARPSDAGREVDL